MSEKKFVLLSLLMMGILVFGSCGGEEGRTPSSPSIPVAAFKVPTATATVDQALAFTDVSAGSPMY